MLKSHKVTLITIKVTLKSHKVTLITIKVTLKSHKVTLINTSVTLKKLLAWGNPLTARGTTLTVMG